MLKPDLYPVLWWCRGGGAIKTLYNFQKSAMAPLSATVYRRFVGVCG